MATPSDKAPPSTTTQKHQNFVTNPLGNKTVTDVPGIGDVLGGGLKKKGISSARQLLGHYLIAPKEFKELIMSVGGNAKQQADAYQAMKEFTAQHID